MTVSSHQDQHVFHGQHFSYIVYTSLNSDYIYVRILQMNQKNCVYVNALQNIYVTLMHVFILNDLYQTEDKRSTREYLLLQVFETYVCHTGV